MERHQVESAVYIETTLSVIFQTLQLNVKGIMEGSCLGISCGVWGK